MGHKNRFLSNIKNNASFFIIIIAHKHIMDKNLLSLVFIVCLIILSEAIAQSCVKKYNSENNLLFLAIAAISYLCVILLLCKSYNYDGMYKINLYWSIGSIVTILLFDVLFFHAEIKKEDLIGVALCITGLYFIFVYGHNSVPS